MPLHSTVVIVCLTGGSILAAWLESKELSMVLAGAVAGYISQSAKKSE